MRINEIINSGVQGVMEGSESSDDLVSTLNSFDYYSDNGKVYVNDSGEKIARQGSNWKHQSGKIGRGAEELGSFLSSKQGVAEGRLNEIASHPGDGYDSLDNEENYRERLLKIKRLQNETIEQMAEKIFQKKVKDHELTPYLNNRNEFYKNRFSTLKRQALSAAYDKIEKEFEEAIQDLNMRMPNGYKQYKQSEKTKFDKQMAKGHADFGRGDM